MKHVTTLSIVICVQALLVFFWIHKENYYISLQRDTQIKKQEVKQLQKEIEDLLYQIHILKNPHHIADYAKKKNLKPIQLKEVNAHDA